MIIFIIADAETLIITGKIVAAVGVIGIKAADVHGFFGRHKLSAFCPDSRAFDDRAGDIPDKLRVGRLHVALVVNAEVLPDGDFSALDFARKRRPGRRHGAVVLNFKFRPDLDSAALYRPFIHV